MNLILAILFSLSALAYDLQVTGTRRSYSLNVSLSEIIFRGDKTSLSLKQEACNKQLREGFYDDFENNIVRGTKIKKTAKSPLTYRLDKQEFMASAGSLMEDKLLKIPEEIVKLKLLESKHCQK